MCDEHIGEVLVYDDGDDDHTPNDKRKDLRICGLLKVAEAIPQIPATPDEHSVETLNGPKQQRHCPQGCEHGVEVEPDDGPEEYPKDNRFYPPRADAQLAESADINPWPLDQIEQYPDKPNKGKEDYK